MFLYEFMNKLFLFILLFYFACSSTENVETKTSQEQLAQATIESPLSKDKQELRLSAPPLQTKEIQKILEKRKKDFSWRYDFTQTENNSIMNMNDSKANREQLIKHIENQKNKYGYRLLCLYKLMSLDVVKKDFSSASATLSKYIKNFSNHKDDLLKLNSLLNSNSEKVELVDLGSEANSHDAYLPIPELNEKKIYYTSINTPGGKGGEDVIEVSFVDGKWTNKRFLKELNSNNHDSPTAISADGTMMVLFGHYSGTLGSGDLFISELKQTGWSQPLHLGYPINSQYFDSDGVFTPDGKAFLFVSDRASGYYPQVRKANYDAGHTWGNTDIYISFIQEDGTFGEPINLGPIVNTPGAERQPFLHPDGKTLYFSSNGFNVNFGNLDVYKTTRLDDTWTNWSEPVNLGKEINTIGADWGFKIAASGERAYISRYNSNTQKDNLYTLEPLPKSVRPEIVILIEGKVVNENGEPLEADLEWEDLNQSKPLGKLKSKPTNGEFLISLPVGKTYAYFAKKQGYLSQSQNIDLTKEKAFKVIPMEIKLVSISHAAKSGEEIVLGNILFQSDKDVLDKRSFSELDRLIKILKDYPTLRIEIQGHTSTAAGRTEDFNIKLSQGRANSVAAYLKSKGIEESRLEAKGYGSSVPLVPNTTEENKSKNRRVSFKILEK